MEQRKVYKKKGESTTQEGEEKKEYKKEGNYREEGNYRGGRGGRGQGRGGRGGYTDRPYSNY
jgi:hypothetical protein